MHQQNICNMKVTPGNVISAPKDVLVVERQSNGFRTLGNAQSDGPGTVFRDKAGVETMTDAAGGTIHANVLADLQQTEAEKKGKDQIQIQSGSEPLSLVDQLWFNVFVSVTVFVNVLVIGLEQDLVKKGAGLADRLLWWMIEISINVLFSIELALRAFTLRQRFIGDFWNVLDLFVVGLAVIDCAVFQPAGSGGKLRLFTCLRLLRIVRLVRLVRMFPLFRELWLLIGGLVNSLKALGWICLVLTLVLYVCSVVVTTEIGQNDEVYGDGPSYDGEVWPYKEYFGSVWRSMFTLFQITTLDGWCDDVVRHIVYFQPFMGIFFVVYLLLTAFGLMNVVVGIIVENTLSAAAVSDSAIEKGKVQKRKKALDQLQVMLELSDSERSGYISLHELKAASTSRVVQAQFQALDVTQPEIEQLFRLLDYNDRGKVELKRFVTSCRELVGGARRRDIAQVEITVGTLAQKLDSLNNKFTKIEDEVSCLGSLTEDFLQNTVRLLTGFDTQDMKQSG